MSLDLEGAPGSWSALIKMWSGVNNGIHEVEDSEDKPVALEFRCQT
jgi:hypothetical protein